INQSSGFYATIKNLKLPYGEIQPAVVFDNEARTGPKFALVDLPPTCLLTLGCQDTPINLG
ncbi:MAG: hypothetical protein ACPGSC_01885, partial [Granulosicoccaceae bacterium]